MPELFHSAPTVTIYADGGTIQENPSPIGMTWAYRILHNGRMFMSGSGSHAAWVYGAPAIYSDDSETIAMLMALDIVRRTIPIDDTFSLALCGDCTAAFYRLVRARYKNKPRIDALTERIASARTWLERIDPKPDIMVEPGSYDPNAQARVRFVLIGSHPVARDFVRGTNDMGTPVSMHNVYCDSMTREEALRFVDGQRGSPPPNRRW